MDVNQWIKDKEMRVSSLEENVLENENVYIGTMEEVKAGMEKGKIKNGMLIAATKLK